MQATSRHGTSTQASPTEGTCEGGAWRRSGVPPSGWALPFAALSFVAFAFMPQALAVVTPEKLSETEAAREAPLVANLRQLNPEAVTGYESAVAAMQREDYAAAERHLEEVHHEVPGFTAATRRLCLAKGALGKREAALALCREAAGDGSSRSLAALSFALTGFGDLAFTPRAAQAREALEVADRAVEEDAEDVLAQRAACLAARSLGDDRRMRACGRALAELDTKERAGEMWLERARVIVAHQSKATEPDPVKLDEAAYVAKRAADLAGDRLGATLVLAEVATLRNDNEALGDAVEELLSSAPDDVRTRHFETLFALAEGDTERARRALARARELGLDTRVAAELETQIDEADPTGPWLPVLGGVLVVSVGVMAVHSWRKRQRGQG